MKADVPFIQNWSETRLGVKFSYRAHSCELEVNVSDNGSEDVVTQEGKFTASVEKFKTAWLAQLEEHVTLDISVLSLSPLGAEIT